MKIHPPFEDLFDTAEEYILLVLLEPWTKMVQLDQLAYRQVGEPVRLTVKLMISRWLTHKKKNK